MLSKTEAEIIRNVVARLKYHKTASDEIDLIMGDPKLRIWLDTWVIAPLEIVSEESSNPAQRRYNLNTALGLSR